MEKKITVTSNSPNEIVALAQELQNVGLADQATEYYEDTEYGMPYFKIVKAFARETDEDPRAEIIFIDVTDEYTVHTRLGHDHFATAHEAAFVVRGLYNGAIAEVALCLPTATLRFLTTNTGDPAQNVQKIADDWQAIMDAASSCVSMPAGVHNHKYFDKAQPFYLQIVPEENYMWDNCAAYLQSVVIGCHAEIYTIDG